MHQDSNLKLYSIGIVVEDKLPNTDYAIIAPMEQLSTADGQLSKTTKIHTANGQSVKKGNTIIAKWYQNGQTNRATSPNVYKNESVKIFRYGDTDKYYWDTLFFEPHLRRLEEVTYSYSNKRVPLETYDANSSYYYTVSTLNKFIHLHTSTNDGEASGYDLLINTKTGEISIIDTNGNQLLWKSVSKQLNILDFKTFNINILDTINTQVGKTMNTQIGQTSNLKVGQTMNTSVGETDTKTVGQTKTLTVPTLNINCKQAINLTTQNVGLVGDMRIVGNLQVSGSINASTINAPNGSVGP